MENEDGVCFNKPKPDHAACVVMALEMSDNEREHPEIRQTRRLSCTKVAAAQYDARRASRVWAVHSYRRSFLIRAAVSCLI